MDEPVSCLGNVASMSSRRRALSMMELTIVILILGITAAFAAPRFAETVRATKLQAAANQLASHIDYIRSVARNEGRTTTLLCDNTLNSYASGEVDFPERHGELIQVDIQQTYDPGFVLTANFDSQTMLSFDFEGVPQVGVTPLVLGSIVLGYGSDKYRVSIAAGTGDTTVSRIVSAGGTGTLDYSFSQQSKLEPNP